MVLGMEQNFNAQNPAWFHIKLCWVLRKTWIQEKISFSGVWVLSKIFNAQKL
jgi:hypothetical protein